MTTREYEIIFYEYFDIVGLHDIIVNKHTEGSFYLVHNGYIPLYENDCRGVTVNKNVDYIFVLISGD